MGFLDETASGLPAPPPDLGRDAHAAAHELVRRLGAEAVRVDDAARLAFGLDATPLHGGCADIVVFPRSTANVATVMSVAARRRLPVTPRGGGTSLCGAAVPATGGIVLVLTAMDRIAPPDRRHLSVVVEPGVPVARVQAVAREHGLAYPPDPAWSTIATIGGHVATAAGGLHGRKYGVARDWVLAVEAVLAGGEVIRCSRDGGYDLVPLLCGSEGTLAVITEITLRLAPPAPASGVGLAVFASPAQCGSAVRRILRAGVTPSVLEFLDRRCLEAVPGFRALAGAGALLIFGQDDAEATVERDLAEMAVCCQREGAHPVSFARAPEAVSRLLEARRTTLPALSASAPLTVVEDVAVPPARLPALVGEIERIADAHGVHIATYGHAGEGNLHPTCMLDPDEGDSVARMRAAFREICESAVRLGGTTTGEHGVGSVKSTFLERQLGPAQHALLRRLKHAFDPLGILNPGKLGS